MHQLPCIDNLVVVDGNVNQYSYIYIMGGNIPESVKQMFMNQQHLFVFQQDHAPCHRAMAMWAWCKNNDRHKMLFSPRSPDVNPV